jgi:probable F420-dependent oxidoreductase
VKFGINLFSVNQRFWPDIAEEADRLGFESLWIPEHVVVPLAATGSPYHGAEHPPVPSDLPVVDPLAMLCYLAARTERIRLGTHVYNIGLRHPFLTARAATTVDILAGGRLDLGIGVGWLRSEWDALGLDFSTRGARADEAIEVCQRLWTEDVVEHHGKFFDFGPTAFEPKPVQKPLALHIGGDGPAALRRAATVGTGWAPMNHSLADLPASLVRLRELTEAAGRTDAIEITVGGTVQTADDVAAYADAGVTRVIVQPWPNSRGAVQGMRRFAREILDTTGSRV